MDKPADPIVFGPYYEPTERSVPPVIETAEGAFFEDVDAMLDYLNASGPAAGQPGTA